MAAVHRAAVATRPMVRAPRGDTRRPDASAATRTRAGIARPGRSMTRTGCATAVPCPSAWHLGHLPAAPRTPDAMGVVKTRHHVAMRVAGFAVALGAPRPARARPPPPAARARRSPGGRRAGGEVAALEGGEPAHRPAGGRHGVHRSPGART